MKTEIETLKQQLEDWKKCAEDMASVLKSFGFDEYHPYVIDFTKLNEKYLVKQIHENRNN
jgi:hypothetical protein